MTHKRPIFSELIPSRHAALWSRAAFFNFVNSASGGGGGAPSATIDFDQIDNPSELVAPVGIWFRATGHSGFTTNDYSLSGNAYEPVKHQVYHFWDFDDAGSFSNAELNIPTAWNNSGVDYNHDAYHVFDTPGSYDVALWAIDESGNVGTVTKTITILDPDTVYSTTRTICVSNQSDYTGAPSGATQVTSIAAAITEAQNQAPTTTRILLRRGETFQESVSFNTQANVRIGAFGSGDRPTWTPPFPDAGTGGGGQCAGYSFGNSIGDSVFHDINFENDWDGTRETGLGMQGSVTFAGHNTVYYNACFYRCRLYGFRDPLSPTNSSAAGYTVGVVDCEIGNWRHIGMFLDAPSSNQGNYAVALVGTSIQVQENACIGNRGQANDGPDNVYGALRYGGTGHFIMSGCSTFSCYTPGGGLQPNLRLAQSGDNTQRAYQIYINRTYVEGGSVLVGIDGQNGSITEWPGNHIMDMCLLVGDYDTAEWAQCDFGGFTIRNSVLYNPATTNRTQAAARFVMNDPDSPGTGNNDAPVSIKHNTFLNIDNAGAVTTNSGGGAWTNYIFNDNINHQPNASSPVDADVDVSQNIPGVQTKNRGRRQGVARPTASPSGVGNGGTFTCSYPAGLSASDFSVSGRHAVYIGGNYWYSHLGHCSFAFGGSNITITNTSNATMTGSALIVLDQDTLATDTSYGSPLDIPLPRLDTGAAGLLAGDPGPLTDFLATVAPGASETGQGPTGAPRASTGRHGGALQTAV